MDDSLVRARGFSPSSIRTQSMRGGTADSQAIAAEQPLSLPDKDDPLPRPGEPYKAHARHGNKPEMTLHFVTKDFSYEGFSYADLERVRLVPGDKPGSGPVLIARFNGSVIVDVALEGRDLHSLYHWIGLHLVAWVWEHPSPAEFADKTATTIRRITFNQVER